MRALLTNDVFLIVAVVSGVTFVLSVLGLPYVLLNLRPDYFTDLRARRGWFADRQAPVRIVGRVLKNVAGALLLIAGISMLFLPGQGLLTILVGLMLLDFPGKRRLELAVVCRPRVIRAVNRLRARFKRPPLLLP